MFCVELPRYLDGRMLPDEAQAMEAHLRECPTCAGELRQWRAIEASVRALPHLAPPPAPSLEEARQLVRRARLESRTSRGGAGSRWLWPLLLPAGALAVAVAAVVLWAGPLLQGGAEPAPPEVAVAPMKSPVEIPAEPEATSEIAPEVAPEPEAQVAKVVPPAPVAKPVTKPAAPRGRLLRGQAQPYEVTLGQHEVVVGSRSRARVTRSDADHTDLTLEEGTAAFQVARRSKNQSFVVRAGDTQVEVVGTRFYVRLQGSAVDVGVQQGVVVVIRNGERHRVEAGQRWEQAGRVSAMQEVPRSLAILVERAREEAPPDPTLDAQAQAKWEAWIADGDYHTLEMAAEQHLKKVPSDGEAWRLLGDSRRAAGNHEGAQAAYERAIRAGPAPAAQRARLAAARHFVHIKHLQGAVDMLEAYLQGEGPESAEALLLLARVQAQQGSRELSRETLRRVIIEHKSSRAAVEARYLLQHWDR